MNYFDHVNLTIVYIPRHTHRERRIHRDAVSHYSFDRAHFQCLFQRDPVPLQGDALRAAEDRLPQQGDVLLRHLQPAQYGLRREVQQDPLRIEQDIFDHGEHPDPRPCAWLEMIY